MKHSITILLSLLALFSYSQRSDLMFSISTKGEFGKYSIIEKQDLKQVNSTYRDDFFPPVVEIPMFNIGVNVAYPVYIISKNSSIRATALLELSIFPRIGIGIDYQTGPESQWKSTFDNGFGGGLNFNIRTIYDADFEFVPCVAAHVNFARWNKKFKLRSYQLAINKSLSQNKKFFSVQVGLIKYISN